MYRYFCIFVVIMLVLSGSDAISFDEKMSVEHYIDVPQEHSKGRTTEFFEGTGEIERYVSAYERTWWAVLKKYAEDIHWISRHDNFLCSGTPAAAAGCRDGYHAAELRIREYINKYGKEEVREGLLKYVQVDDE